MKVVNINVERNKHLDKVINFLQKEDADVVCFQEMMDVSVQKVSDALKMKSSFTPFAILQGWSDECCVDGNKWGVAILTKNEHKVLGEKLYQGDGKMRIYENGKWKSSNHDLISRFVLLVKAYVDENEYVVGTTHFTYTPDGLPDSFQEKSADNLLDSLREYENMILCGDFNVPRKINKIYKKIKEEFKDNIPLEYDSSLDPKMHRAKGLKRMVDYVWSRGNHVVSNVGLKTGVSDHCAVVADVKIDIGVQ